MNPLNVISPIDGRYGRYTAPLADFFSERALMRYRLMIEGEYFIYLAEHPIIQTRTFSDEEKMLVRTLYSLPVEEAEIIKAIETKGHDGIKATNHDVKAVEYYMKKKLKGTSLKDSLEWIHFALTSEDVNSIAYGLMLGDSMGNVILPAICGIQEKIREKAGVYQDIPMLARTHGQAASPTTVGKEFAVFAARLEQQIKQLESHVISCKCNGATGNYNALHVAYPSIMYEEAIAYTQKFFEHLDTQRETINPASKNRLRLTPNLITTQIEPHDTYAELFSIMSRINTILIGFNQDIWRYISDDWFKQRPVEGEVGSSTMPHKVNPIDFENSEGNLGFANAQLAYFSAKLPISRLQRDLSDSTVERNFGVALGHCLVGYKSTLKGLDKIEVNQEKVIAELERHPEVIVEAYQTILRREKADAPYEQLSALTRGRRVTFEELQAFVNRLDVSSAVKEELQRITPTNYIGIAALLV